MLRRLGHLPLEREFRLARLHACDGVLRVLVHDALEVEPALEVVVDLFAHFGVLHEDGAHARAGGAVERSLVLVVDFFDLLLGDGDALCAQVELCECHAHTLSIVVEGQALFGNCLLDLGVVFHLTLHALLNLLVGGQHTFLFGHLGGVCTCLYRWWSRPLWQLPFVGCCRHTR